MVTILSSRGLLSDQLQMLACSTFPLIDRAWLKRPSSLWEQLSCFHEAAVSPHAVPRIFQPLLISGRRKDDPEQQIWSAVSPRRALESGITNLVPTDHLHAHVHSFVLPIYSIHTALNSYQLLASLLVTPSGTDCPHCTAQR